MKTHTLVVAGVLAFSTLAVRASVQTPGTNVPQYVYTSSLFDELRGFGGNTTGGVGGRLYLVTRTDDPLPTVPGTLRYGVEEQSGATWIVFDKRVFPAATKRIIYLRSWLSPRSNLTIDGRGSYVSLRRVYYNDHANWNLIDTDTWRCV